MDRERTAVRRQAWSVGVATGAYGISFGAVGVAAGLSVAQTSALSLLMFSGGSQFAFAGAVAGGSGPLTAIATAALVGARNGFYGLQMAPLLQASGLRRLAAVQLTIDESTAVGSAPLAADPPRPDLGRFGFWAAGIAVFVFWNLATLAGALIGSALGDPRTYGFDAAAGAAFLALLWPRLKTVDARWVALAATAIAVTAVPFAASGIPVLLAGFGALIIAAYLTMRPTGLSPSSPSSPSPSSPSPSSPSPSSPSPSSPSPSGPPEPSDPSDPSDPGTTP